MPDAPALPPGRRPRGSIAAQRQRRFRARRRSGLATLRVQASYDHLVAALIESTRLSEGAAMDRAQVEAAAAEVLAEWAARWVQK